MSTTTTEPKFREDRFRKLYEANVRTPEERISMETYWTETDCGTVGCLCGHYAAAHPEDGFVVRNREFVLFNGYPMVLYDWSEHFGIDGLAGLRLFGPHVQGSKRELLARLRAFAAERGLELPEYQGEGAGT